MALKVKSVVVVTDDRVFQVGTGTTAERPDPPVTGMIRYNTDLNSFEGYINGNWNPIGDDKAKSAAFSLIFGL